MQPYVFVIDTEKSPCNPVHPAEARKLMREGKAAVWRCFPFTIILKEQRPGAREEHLVKIDPGSRATGIVVVRKIPGKEALKVVWSLRNMAPGADHQKEDGKPQSLEARQTEQENPIPGTEIR